MADPSRSQWLHVAVAVVRNSQGDILIAKRPDHLHQGGLWEFPGGKVEKGEGIEQALVRELHEEIGIDVYPKRPLIEVRHNYGDKKVRLEVWLCEVNAEHAQQSRLRQRGKEGQWVRWAAPQTLVNYDFPAANRPILEALSLPSLYLITPEVGDAGQFLECIDLALARGIKLIQLRDNSLSESEYIKLAGVIGERCNAAGARLLIKGCHRLVNVETAAGVHLTSHELRQFNEYELSCPRENTLLGASCHNQEDVRLAEQVGVNFITLSPVLATASHPDTNPLGWESFQAYCKQATVPVYGLGGLKPEQLQTAWAAGAQGLAAIRGLWPASS